MEELKAQIESLDVILVKLVDLRSEILTGRTKAGKCLTATITKLEGTIAKLELTYAEAVDEYEIEQYQEREGVL